MFSEAICAAQVCFSTIESASRKKAEHAFKGFHEQDATIEVNDVNVKYLALYSLCSAQKKLVTLHMMRQWEIEAYIDAAVMGEYWLVYKVRNPNILSDAEVVDNLVDPASVGPLPGGVDNQEVYLVDAYRCPHKFAKGTHKIAPKVGNIERFSDHRPGPLSNLSPVLCQMRSRRPAHLAQTQKPQRTRPEPEQDGVCHQQRARN